MIDLDEIERCANAATPGPWKHEGQEVRAACHVAFCGEAANSRGATNAQDCTRNARFIASARTDVPALIAEVRRLRGEIDAMAAELHAMSVRRDAEDHESAIAALRAQATADWEKPGEGVPTVGNLIGLKRE